MRRTTARGWLKTFLLYFLTLETAFGPALLSAGTPSIPGFYGKVGNAAPPPAAQALPQLREIVQGVDSLEKPADNKLIVHQNKDKAIIDWNSFDIGADAWTHFDQKGNTNWSALNRIYDQNPSQIFGKLSADGKVYMINQNGILFSRGAQVNVHGLAASSLNIRNDDFIDDRLRFRREDYAGTGLGAGVVANHGTIRTDIGGSVFLIGPDVENSGSIESPQGQIALAAGEDVEILTQEKRLAKTVNVHANPGTAENFAGGRLVTDQGTSGMYGRVVNQNGLIRSVTAFRRGGNIELFASERIVTGVDSLTECPIDGSDERVHESLNLQQGNIRLAGLNHANPESPSSATQVIEHRGDIAAPGGNVSLTAEERVYLAETSRIDVAGNWVNAPASAEVVEMQLNSVELRDEQGQKSGEAKGEKVSFSKLTGSTLGHVYGALENEQKTARESAVTGGTIAIKVREGIVDSNPSRGDIVMREGAVLDVSGGGIHYGAGGVDTTRVAVGDRIYTLDSAPEWLRYDKILGYQEKVYRRHGQTESFRGIYYGGGGAFKDHVAAHSEGADAGLLKMTARQIHLGGVLRGGATAGIFQDLLDELPDGIVTSKFRTQGRALPQNGRLGLGGGAASGVAQIDDYHLEDVVLQQNTSSLGPGFDVHSRLPGAGSDQSPYTTYLGADVLNRSGMGTISILNNLTFATAADASVNLSPGGKFEATARRIEHRGAIRVPSGTITLTADENTTFYQTIEGSSGPNPRYKMPELTRRLVLTAGSRLDVSGERVDNSGAALGQGRFQGLARIQGGAVHLQGDHDDDDGVFVENGARIDLRGGYAIDPGGAVRAGDAGQLSARGDTVVLGGEIDGHALVGAKGGHLDLHATHVRLSAGVSTDVGVGLGGDVPEAVKHTLVFDTASLDRIGASSLTVQSVNDLTVAPGTVLAPSRERELAPTPRRAKNGPLDTWATAEGAPSATEDRPGYARLDTHQLGATGFSLVAGAIRTGDDRKVDPKIDAQVAIAEGSRIEAAPGGTISVTAPYLRIAGELAARSGEITLRATEYDLTLAGGGRLDVKGTIRPSDGPVVKGDAGIDHIPSAGGTVSLIADEGGINLQADSLIDISGAPLIRRRLPRADGTVKEVSSAAEAGQLNLSFFTDLDVTGTIDARAELGLNGGTLTLLKKNPSVGLVLNSEMVSRFTQKEGRTDGGGFDDLTLGAYRSIAFEGPTRLAAGRHLTLDAPELTIARNDRVEIDAPWVSLINTSDKYGSNLNPYSYIPTSAAVGDGVLSVRSQWTDLAGSFVVSGAAVVKLQGQRPDGGGNRMVRLRDVTYDTKNNIQEGRLLTGANIDIISDMITPGTGLNSADLTGSDFTFRTGGKFTTQPGGGSRGAGFAAGGRINVEAADIEHNGAFVAPLGAIRLAAGEGRVMLGRESRISTVADEALPYGLLSETYWYRKDRRNLASVEGVRIAEAPRGTVELAGRQTIIIDGAEIDASGSRQSVFAKKFLPSIAGSENPLTRKGSYVVVPGRRIDLPGQAIQLSGNGAPDGIYTILPAEYAFLKGALVLTETSGGVMPGSRSMNGQGSPIVFGTLTHAGQAKTLAATQAYTLRPATDVIAEGLFLNAERTAGGGGSVAIDGHSVLMRGRIRGTSLPGFQGGTLTMRAGDITIGTQSAPLPENINFGTSLADLGVAEGSMAADARGMAENGFSILKVGVAGETRSVVLEEGARLSGDQVILAADETIQLQSGSAVEARGGTGIVTLLTPEGRVEIAQNAGVHAANGVVLSTGNLDVRGSLTADNSSLALTGGDIYVVPDGFDRTGPGIYITPTLMAGLESFDKITLAGSNGLHIMSAASLTVADTLTMDTPRLMGHGLGAADEALLSAATIRLNNSHAAAVEGPSGGLGALTIDAGRVILGPGDVDVGGFASLNLRSREAMTMEGRGSLQAAAATHITAPALALRAYVTPAATTGTAGDGGGLGYEAADYRFDSRGYAFSMTGGGSGAVDSDKGNLRIEADRIDIATGIHTAGGRMILAAVGEGAENGVRIATGATLNVSGDNGAAGGSISLNAAAGAIDIREAAVLDLSGNGSGDAGSLSLEAPEGRVVVDGTLRAATEGGRGGKLRIVTGDAQDASLQIERAAQGGFSESFELLARQGNLTIAAGDILTARRIALSADQGNLDLFGTLNADASGGGRVSLSAGDNLTLHNESRIFARGLGNDSEGGSLQLAVNRGTLSMAAGAQIDARGMSSGRDGQVHFRAQREGTTLRMDLNGRVTGASRVTAEAVRVYTPDAATPLNSAYIDARIGEAETFMGQLSWQSGLQGATVAVRPGIEILSAAFDAEAGTGNLAVVGGVDLTGRAPGILTLRAAGNLAIQGDIADHPADTNGRPLTPDYTPPETWQINLVGGADLASADRMAVNNAQGGLTLAGRVQVYSENGAIRFAAGGDMRIGEGTDQSHAIPDMKYSLATFGADIEGAVGGNLTITAGAIQSAAGDIRIGVGGDLILAKVGGVGAMGTIRTTGRYAPGPQVPEEYWPDLAITGFADYAQGGDIELTVGGAVKGELSKDAWDRQYLDEVTGAIRWAASYSIGAFTEGLATMAGGDLNVTSGGDFFSQAGTFGAGDLAIRSGGDLDGRILVNRGTGRLAAEGNIGGRIENMAIELRDAQMSATARGNITLGTVMNPTLGSRFWKIGGICEMSYSIASAISLETIHGDVILTGRYPFDGMDTSARTNILPANVTLRSENGSVRLAGTFRLAPAPTGNLIIEAGIDIDGRTPTGVANKIVMLDCSATDFYGYRGTIQEFDALSSGNNHAAVPLHAGDREAIRIVARRDIRDIQFYLPKIADISAGRDIRDILYDGLNLDLFDPENPSHDDVSRIAAGRDIFFDTRPGTSNNNFGILQRGPGRLLVQAAGEIDLGTSQGIKGLGNFQRPELPVEGGNLYVIAGYGGNFDTAAIDFFFGNIRDYGKAYTQLLAEGKEAEAADQVTKTRDEVIAALLEGHSDTVGDGRLNMINSQISAAGKYSGVYVVSRAAVNVGRSTLSQDFQKNSGIYTQLGGDIGLFARGREGVAESGDLNINEARVMTFWGGDIVMWSDYGNINAGRGSKTAISKPDTSSGFQPPAVGSGIRTLTYDADGPEGPGREPNPGDLYIFAPQGEIDAGEAGISGANVFLGAVTVTNAQNIEVGGTGVGVPDTSAAAGLGALSGAGGLSDAGNTAESAAVTGSAQQRFSKYVEELSKDLVPKWIAVEVIGFDEGQAGTLTGEDSDESRP